MMYFYQGGNHFDHTAENFIFDQNYLSDLGRSLTFSGEDNGAYVFYTITLSLVGVGIILLFALLTSTVTKHWKYAVIFLGSISGIAYIGIALNPVNESLMPHIIFGKIAFFAFFFSSVGIHILLDKKTYPTSNKLLYFLNIIMFLYLLLTLFGPPSSTGIWALQLKTVAQKTVVYTLIICAILILYELIKKRKPPEI